jgi:hypothetical protein
MEYKVRGSERKEKGEEREKKWKMRAREKGSERWKVKEVILFFILDSLNLRPHNSYVMNLCIQKPYAL